MCEKKNREQSVLSKAWIGRGMVHLVLSMEMYVNREYTRYFFTLRGERFSMRSGAADKHLDTNVARVGRQHYSRRSKTRSIHNRCQHLMHRNLTQPCWRQF